MMSRDKNTNNFSKGFTLIELLVVIAIIALLSSVALVAYQSARMKSRNVKRLGDATQMNTALELFFAANKGYPSSVHGLPASGDQGLTPNYASTLPVAPQPADGVCDGMTHSAPVTADNGGTAVPANTYYYIATGAPYINGPGGFLVYPSYTFYFCLGAVTGNFNEGERLLTPSGVQ